MRPTHVELDLLDRSGKVVSTEVHSITEWRSNCVLVGNVEYGLAEGDGYADGSPLVWGYKWDGGYRLTPASLTACRLALAEEAPAPAPEPVAPPGPAPSPEAGAPETPPVPQASVHETFLARLAWKAGAAKLVELGLPAPPWGELNEVARAVITAGTEAVYVASTELES